MKNYTRLLVLFIFAVGSFHAATASNVCSPSESASMSAAASYCKGNTASPIQFRYSSCTNEGTGARVGTAITIKWYKNTENSTTGGTLVHTSSCTSDTSTTLGTLSYTPSTSVAGTSYYYCVITWSGSGKCNTSGSLTSAVTTAVTVIAPAATITGDNIACGDATTALHNCVAGGTWSSSNTAVATVDSAGLVTGITPGTALINYFTGCGTTATRVVSVNTIPVVAAITGNTSGCIGVNRTLANTTTGGVWSSDNTDVATITSAGVTHGVAAGTATISYQVTNNCATTVVTTAFTVSASPAAGTITGATSVCVGDNAIVYNDVMGGVWSSRVATKASVAPTAVPGIDDESVGSIAGVTIGTTIISYTVTNSCGSAYATKIITVNPLPSAGAITGTLIICGTGSRTLSKTVAGGIWSSDNTDVAAVGSSTGVVTGASVGTAAISYSVSNGCGTASVSKIVTVNPTPNAGSISGNNPICIGTVDTLTDSVSGGTWSSSYPGRVSIDASGVITALAAGNATISYTVSNSCGTVRATMIITVSAFPGPGNLSTSSSLAMCQGATRTMSSTVATGTWSTGNADVAAISSTGLVTGMSVGTAAISYSVTNVCGTAVAMKVFTVNPLPDAGTLSGNFYTCIAAGTPLSSTVSGGTWSSSSTSKATVGVNSGIVTGISAGTTTISYKYTNSCGSDIVTQVFSVVPVPVVGVITGTAAVCVNGSTILDDAPDNGIWSSNNSTIASIDADGVVTGQSAGTTVITFASINACGTAISTRIVTVNGLPENITGTPSVCIGSTTQLADATNGGTWSSNASEVAVCSASGNVSGVSEGTAIITYSLANGCSATAIVTVNTPTMRPGAATAAAENNAPVLDIKLFPNPNNAVFNVKCASGNEINEEITIEITDMRGNIVYSNNFVLANGNLDTQVALGSNIANGMYILNLKTKTYNKAVTFAVQR